MAEKEYNKGWVYRYDFKNGDCYVGKEGSFNPFLRATEHLQDALTVAYPEEFSGFKIRLRGTSAKYVTVNKYTRTNVQKLGWQWGFAGLRNKETGKEYTHDEIERKRKEAGTGTVRGVYWTIDDVTKEGWRDVWSANKDEFESRSPQNNPNFKDIFDKLYSGREQEKDNPISTDFVSRYKTMTEKVRSWKFITVDELRNRFQVSKSAINALVAINQIRINQGGDDLTRVLKVIFGKDGQKKQDWINIFYNEIAVSGKGGSSMLDVCEMFATLNAYYEHRMGKTLDSSGIPGEMLNNEILKAKFDFLIDNNRVPASKAIRQSIDLQKELANDKNLLDDIISRLRKTGDKGGANIKKLYKADSSAIAKIIAWEIKTTKIWTSDTDHTEEMFEKVENLLTSRTFSGFGATKKNSFPFN